MNVDKIIIHEKSGCIKKGTATILGIDVEFCYNTIDRKFTARAYNKYQSNGIFPEAHNQVYLVGRAISKHLEQTGG